MFLGWVFSSSLVGLRDLDPRRRQPSGSLRSHLRGLNLTSEAEFLTTSGRMIVLRLNSKANLKASCARRARSSSRMLAGIYSLSTYHRLVATSSFTRSGRVESQAAWPSGSLTCLRESQTCMKSISNQGSACGRLPNQEKTHILLREGFGRATLYRRAARLLRSAPAAPRPFSVMRSVD